MTALILVYFIYLILYAVISYAILFHLQRFRIEGDVSGVVMGAYIFLSLAVIFTSIAFLRPF